MAWGALASLPLRDGLPETVVHLPPGWLDYGQPFAFPHVRRVRVPDSVYSLTISAGINPSSRGGQQLDAKGDYQGAAPGEAGSAGSTQTCHYQHQTGQAEPLLPELDQGAGSTVAPTSSSGSGSRSGSIGFQVFTIKPA